MIIDNPDIIAPYLSELKINYLTHQTKDLRFRK